MPTIEPAQPETAATLKRRPLFIFCLALAAALGLGSIANGAIMLVAPARWYASVPGVTATGAFNQHFLRDIGLIFLLVGFAFLAGIVRSRLRIALWGAGAFWLTGHALFHLWEVAAGICGPYVLVRDFPAVSLPAIIALGLTGWAARLSPPAASPPSP